MVKQTTLMAAVMAFLTTIATATPYWISYEGDVFPETQGWTRGYGGDGVGSLGSYREIIDGDILLLDSRRGGWEIGRA